MAQLTAQLYVARPNSAKHCQSNILRRPSFKHTFCIFGRWSIYDGQAPSSSKKVSRRNCYPFGFGLKLVANRDHGSATQQLIAENSFASS